jgi:hypothetical protein
MLDGIRHILSNNAGVTALVPAADITPGFRPQSQSLPGVVMEWDGTEATNCKGATSMMDSCTLRLTAFTQSYADAIAITNACRAAIDGFSGTALSHQIEQIVYVSQDDDYFSVDHPIHAITASYTVMIKRVGEVPTPDCPDAGGDADGGTASSTYDDTLDGGGA